MAAAQQYTAPFLTSRKGALKKQQQQKKKSRGGSVLIFYLFLSHSIFYMVNTSRIQVGKCRMQEWEQQSARRRRCRRLAGLSGWERRSVAPHPGRATSLDEDSPQLKQLLFSCHHFCFLILLLLLHPSFPPPPSFLPSSRAKRHKTVEQRSTSSQS